MTNARWENNTTLLFLLAIFLAWPTFGLSLLVLFGWLAWTGYNRGKNAEKREAFSLLLKPIFEYRHRPDDSKPEDGYSDFIHALNLPLKSGCFLFDEQMLHPTTSHMRQCGRLVMQYLAHNPREAATFVKAIRVVDSNGDSELREVLQWEDSDALTFKYDSYSSDVRLICFRAVEALMTNNSLSCFECYDLEIISEMVNEMSERQKAVAKKLR